MRLAQGQFRILNPTKSRKGYWICGGIAVAEKGLTYVERVASREELRAATERIRKNIIKDHPGFVEVGRSN